MKHKVNLNQLANEISQRETLAGRSPNMTEIKRHLRHISDLMAEEWTLNYELRVAEALRRNGMGRMKKK